MTVMCKYEVIHKTGSIQHIGAPPKEDRVTAVGNMIGHVVLEICSRTGKQINIGNRHADHNAPLPNRG